MSLDQEKRDALKDLVKDVVKAMGPIDPAALPHRLRERLEAHGAGDADIEMLIKETLADLK